MRLAQRGESASRGARRRRRRVDVRENPAGGCGGSAVTWSTWILGRWSTQQHHRVFTDVAGNGTELVQQVALLTSAGAGVARRRAGDIPSSCRAVACGAKRVGWCPNLSIARRPRVKVRARKLAARTSTARVSDGAVRRRRGGNILDRARRLLRSDAAPRSGALPKGALKKALNRPDRSRIEEAQIGSRVNLKMSR